MNILNINGVSVDNVQSVVKTVKARTSLDLSCDSLASRLSDDATMSQVKAVENLLNIESSNQITDILSKETLQTASEMFLYLIMCPYTMKPWLAFYKDLFQAQSPDQIMLALNRVMKGPNTPTNEFFKEMAGILSKRISSKLSGSEEEVVTFKDKAKQPQKLEGREDSVDLYH